ncbi:MAG TPA: VOC family protein [Tepidisphaeraceae bacterium]|jgi:predicted enzyme related to lactoylglutathione lyase
MGLTRLNLVVLRVADIDRSASFYSRLGLTFTKHAHGTGPQHYASESDGFVFELYPSSAEHPPTTSVRVGFAVANVDDVLSNLATSMDATIIVGARNTEWGRRAVIADPDGHRIELLASIEAD